MIFPVYNSRLSAMATCETQALMQYVYDFQKAEESVAAECGKAAHVALAHHFAGGAMGDCLDAFEREYRELSEKEVATDDRLDWRNVRDVLQRYIETHSVERFPFEPIVEGIETPVMVPLIDGEVEFYALIDLPSRDKATGGRYPVDHKTTGRITSWWAKKFHLSSQMTGYMYAESVHSGEAVPGAFINAIELGKLPTAKTKCRVHKVPYYECRLEHTKFELFVVNRTPPAMEQWLKDAKVLAMKFKTMALALPKVEMIGFAKQQGVFNNGCTFCDFKDFCAAGRPPEMAASMFIKKRWAPWDERVRG